MRRAIFVLEAINAIVGLITNIPNLRLFGLPVSTWNTIVFLVFVVGFVALFWSDKNLEKHIYNKVMTNITKSLETTKPQEGSLNSVSSQDRRLILSFSKEMIVQHGHMDFFGLLADRASGVPLNELMLKNCSICGEPRNKQSKENIQES